MNISIRVSETDIQLIKAFANYNNETVSSYIKRLVMNDIEAAYTRAIERYLEMPEFITDR